MTDKHGPITVRADAQGGTGWRSFELPPQASLSADARARLQESIAADCLLRVSEVEALSRHVRVRAIDADEWLHSCRLANFVIVRIRQEVARQETPGKIRF